MLIVVVVVAVAVAVVFGFVVVLVDAVALSLLLRLKLGEYWSLCIDSIMALSLVSNTNTRIPTDEAARAQLENLIKGFPKSEAKVFVSWPPRGTNITALDARFKSGQIALVVIRFK